MPAHIVLTAVVCLAVAPCRPTEVRVWDGDTAWFGPVKVRMHGYDTPEFAGHARCPAEEKRAERARERLAALIAAARRVVVAPTGAHSYDRTVADILIDGRSAGAVLASEGLAIEGMGDRRTWCGR